MVTEAGDVGYVGLEVGNGVKAERQNKMCILLFVTLKKSY